MKKAIYFRLMVLAFVAVLLCSLISATIYAVYTQNQTKEWLTKLTLSAAENYKYDTDVHALSKVAGDNRITIIAPNGKVLADSEANVAEMENHGEREEVKYAKADRVTVAMRTSSTLGERFMYAAIKTHDGNILRLAYSYAGLLHNLRVQLPAVLTAIMIALLLSLLLAGRLTKTVTSPLEQMVESLSARQYDKLSAASSPYYEIEKVMQALQELLQTITDSHAKLQSEREKVDYILSHMAEGFVLVDSQKNILLCNNSARAFFFCGEDIKLDALYQLTRNQTVLNALQTAIEQKQSATFDMELPGDRLVNVYVSPSQTAEDEWGATMLLVDMTAQKQLEQQKRDFFLGASHELKTPITSILGFSEMLNKDMVKSEEEKAEILRRIEAESKRMSELIGDILTVSQLESGSQSAEHTVFDFSDIVKEAAAAVSPTQIEINLDLDEISYHADRRQMYTLCVNLIENAIKYNKSNGKVDISLKAKDNGLTLTVADTGIGIPPEYQARVFERFFRVDSGRDKATGGTGLGLAIVKHIVSLYAGKISLQSEINEGTTIVVALPQNLHEER